MATITIKAKDGLQHQFLYTSGVSYPSRVTQPDGDRAKHIQLVKSLSIRDDDIYLVTYPKSGTHWTWEVISMLRNGDAQYATTCKETAFLDMRSVTEIHNLSSPRILNSHYPVKLMPRQIIEKGTKIVYVQRNPKDVAVSYYNHRNTTGHASGQKPTFAQFLPLVIGQYGFYNFYPWFKHVKEWERFQKHHQNQMLTLYFEDMKEDPLREIRNIDSFLGYNRSDKTMAAIADACSFNKLKKADKEIKSKHKAGKFKDVDFIYRKGEVGDWKNWFTVAQNEMMDAWLEENLVDTDLKFRYEL